MINDPTISVTCDNCDCEEHLTLYSIAGGGWDARFVPGKLERKGWKQDGDHWLCEDCALKQVRSAKQKKAQL